MNTCDTCKWWDRSEPNPNLDMSEKLMGFRECKCPKVASESNYPEEWKWRDDANKDAASVEKEQKRQAEIKMNPPLDLAYASADDYYPALFETGPKFGCIHHESLE